MASKAKKYRREGCKVLKAGTFFAEAKDGIAAATIVHALELAEGRTVPKDD